MARGFLPRGHLLATCHRERSVAIYWQGDCRAVYSARLAMTKNLCQVFSRVTMPNNIIKNQSIL
jgi:hypothetical protein